MGLVSSVGKMRDSCAQGSGFYSHLWLGNFYVKLIFKQYDNYISSKIQLAVRYFELRNLLNNLELIVKYNFMYIV